MPGLTDPDLEQVAAAYRARRDRFAAERDLLARRSLKISTARLAAFLVGVGGLGWGLLGASAQRGAIAAAGAAALALFVALVVLHERVLRRHARAEGLAAQNDVALHRLARDWERVPRPRSPDLAAGADEAVARDLNLFGHGGLFHLTATAVTPGGKRVLARWLRAPAPPETVRARQLAVAELAPQLELRQELELRARLGPELAHDPEGFLRWAEAAPWLTAPRRAYRLWLPRLGAIAAIALCVAHATGLVPYPLWLLAAGANLLLDAALGREPRAVLHAISSGEREHRAYAELLELVARANVEAPLLRELQQALGAAGAARELRRLDLLVGLAEVRRGGLFHVPLQALLLWDYHALFLLERWQARAGRRARAWLERLGELEALAALGGLRHDNPGWCFPAIAAEGEPRLRARALGHPLLPPDRCVANDVELGPPGSFLLVTGSNMSGKSTLLRALGVNAALAQAGGPACARELALSPLELGTSFIAQDSLTQGVSFFMAELQRLKQVVDRARRSSVEAGALLFLLDEILLGTNIAERQIAVRQVLLHLIRERAIGAISSHDLTLASAPGIAPACRAVHFRERYQERPDGSTEMIFDYKLHEGVATTQNALALLRMVGLGETEAPP